MASMVIVNNPGDWGTVYAPLLHAEWNGWTPTDLIFPFFLFIVGVAITLSRKAGHPRSIAVRAAKLVGLGLFLSGFPWFNLTTLRLPGVLQRIGLCYLAAALLYWWLQRGSAGREGPVTDGRHAKIIGGVAAALLLGYWAIIMLVPGASGQTGDMTPEGNVGAVLDRAIFGTHLWKKTWDPEGLLSTLPAIGTTLLGLLAGLWLRHSRADGRRLVTGLVVGGLVATVVALAWSTVFPLNKSLWTSSYAVFTAGLGALLFAFCYATIDLAGWRRWAHPFVVLGTNAIALFVLSGLVARLLGIIKVTGPDGGQMSLQSLIYRQFFVPLASPMNASLLFALANLAVLYIVLWVMYRRGIFLKV